jgi:hypothetical protein
MFVILTQAWGDELGGVEKVKVRQTLSLPTIPHHRQEALSPPRPTRALPYNYTKPGGESISDRSTIVRKSPITLIKLFNDIIFFCLGVGHRLKSNFKP